MKVSEWNGLKGVELIDGETGEGKEREVEREGGRWRGSGGEGREKRGRERGREGEER